MAPYLNDGQVVVLNPNASLGVVEFKKTLDDCGCKANITIACTATLLFACRAMDVGHVKVAGQKKSFSAAAYPSSKNGMVGELFKDIFPQFNFCDDIIRVSLDNLNALVHPSPSILNTGRIESGIDFEYYLDFTPSQGKYIDELDKERMAIGEAYGLNINTFVDEYKCLYNTKGDDAYEVLVNCEGYHGIMGQKKLRTRYILEDIPCSLVALQSLGQIAGVETPAMDAMITVAKKIINEIPEGRTVKNLGLEGVTKEDFIKICRA
jgi:opine dehydrogenase